jgi:hypothetical protein
LSYSRRRNIQRLRRKTEGTIPAFYVTSTSVPIPSDDPSSVADATIPTAKVDISADHPSTEVPPVFTTTEVPVVGVTSDGLSTDIPADTVTTGQPNDGVSVSSAQSSDYAGVPKVSDDKGKAPMVEEDLGSDHAKAEQERILKCLAVERADVELAVKMQAKLDADFQRLNPSVASTLPPERKRELDDASLKFTTENWNNILSQVTTNPSLAQTILGDAFDGDDYVEKMVALANQRKKADAERKAKEKRDKPMTQAKTRDYMRNFVKNMSSVVYNYGWSMGFNKSLSDDELLKQYQKIQSNLKKSRIQFNETLKRPANVLEEPDTKRLKSADSDDTSKDAADVVASHPVVESTEEPSYLSADPKDGSITSDDPPSSPKNTSTSHEIPPPEPFIPVEELPKTQDTTT